MRKVLKAQYNHMTFFSDVLNISVTPISDILHLHNIIISHTKNTLATDTSHHYVKNTQQLWYINMSAVIFEGALIINMYSIEA